MYASNSYTVRIATDDDAEALRRLAVLDSKAPLEGAVVVGEIAGRAAAAVSLTDDRAIADPFIPTAQSPGDAAPARARAERRRADAVAPRAAHRRAADRLSRHDGRSRGVATRSDHPRRCGRAARGVATA